MKAVLFDLDGVITSERIYWNCSGLAIAKYKGLDIPKKIEERVKLAQSVLPDRAIQRLKNAGINSNWDITYLVMVADKNGVSMEEFLDELERGRYTGMDYLKLLDKIDHSEKHDRNSGSWKEAHRRFRACYRELRNTDEPIMPLNKIKNVLGELRSMGLKLGIVTGRPLDEAKIPLEKWGLWSYFDKTLIVTDDEVRMESNRRGRHIGKPDGWPILHAIAMHERCSEADARLRAGDYLLIGDSTSDVLSAKSAGAPVICVRTGIASAESLKKAGCDIIVDDLTKVLAEVKKMLES